MNLNNTNLTRFNTPTHMKQNVHYSLSSHMGLLCIAASFHSLFPQLSIKTAHSIIVSLWIQKNLLTPAMFCSLWHLEQITNTMKPICHTTWNVFPDSHATVCLWHIQGNITLTSNIQKELSDTNRPKKLHASYEYIKCGSIYLHV